MVWVVNTKLWANSNWHSNEFSFAKTEYWLKITRIAFWKIYHVYNIPCAKKIWLHYPKQVAILWRICKWFFTRESIATKQEFNKTLNIFWKRFFALPIYYFSTLTFVLMQKNVFLKRGITFKVFIYNTISSLDKWKFICSRKPALFQKSLLILH